MDTLPHIRRTIAELKHPGDFEAIPRIPVIRREQVVASLRPVPSELKGQAFADGRLMAEWRNFREEAFFNWITSTEGSTGEWLTEKYGPDNEDIIFMIETPDGLPFGHVALYNFQCGGTACEFGRLLRGPAIGVNGGMTLGSSALLLWAVSELNVEQFFLEVFNDNQKAISLYERLGFSGTDTVPLKRIDTGRFTRWEKHTEEPLSGTAADAYALRMETTAEQLRQLRQSTAGR